ncbi:MAG: ABC transporter permease [Steroidobacteraceae bacterium]
MTIRTRAFTLTMQRELARWRHDRLTRWLMVWLPLIGCLLLVWIFAKRSVVDLPVVAVDRDNSAQSRALLRAIDAAPAVHINQQSASMRDAASAVRAGRAYAVIEIPARFERDLLRGKAPAVLLYANEQALTAANSIARDVQTVVLTTSATFSAGLRMQQGVPELAAAAATQAIRAEVHALFNPGIDYAAYLAIALVAATLHSFVLIHAVMSTGTERRDRTMGAWSAASGDSPIVALAGKLIPLVFWWTAFGFTVLSVTYAALGMAPGGNWLALAGGFSLLVTAYAGMGACMALWLPELRIAASAASLIAAPAVAFSGLTFPLAAMPLGARLAGEMLPLTHFLHLQVAQVIMQTSVSSSWGRLLWLAGFTALSGLFALIGMRRVLRSNGEAAQPTP